MASWERSQDNPNRDLELSAAFVRMAYLFGDRNAAAYLYHTYPGIDIDRLVIVDRQAATMFRRLRRHQIAVYGQASPIMARPDAADDAAQRKLFGDAW